MTDDPTPMTLEQTLEAFLDYLKVEGLLPAGEYNYAGISNDFVERQTQTGLILPVPALPPVKFDTPDPSIHRHLYEDKWWPYRARQGKNPPQQWRECVLPGCTHFQTKEVRGG